MGYRVIQWATGSMGKTCLRAVIDHPDLELVGLLVYSDAKASKDAGEIAHRGRTGVIATRDVDEILALDADVVLHTPRIQFPYSHHNDDICRLLASGKNVISVNGHSYPAWHGSKYSDAFEKACQKGNSSFFGTGLNPGFIAEKIAAAATGICLEIDHIQITEIFDVIGVPDRDYVFNVCGFGSDPAAFDLSENGPVAELMGGMYTEVVALLAKRIGITLDDIICNHEIAPAPGPIQARAGNVPEGTVAATHWRWHGVKNGKPLITLCVSWIMGDAMRPNQSDDHWKIMIRGKPGIEITMNLVEPEATKLKTRPEQYAVAGSVINSIPEVCAARAGIFEPPLFAPFRAPF